MIYTVTLNPALDKTVQIADFSVNTVNRISAVRCDAGGKGINVSKVIQSLGGESVAMGILAGHTGKQIENALTQMGIACRFLFTQGETRTNLKIIDPSRHTNTDINEPGTPVSEELLQKILENLLKQLKNGDIVVLSGSLPMGAPQDLYQSWVAACKEKGATVFLDADGPRLRAGLEGKPHWIKPNLSELEQLAGRSLCTEEEIIAAGQALGLPWVAISMGQAGALFLHEKEVYKGWGIPVRVGSTVGAGDSMVAALAYGMDKKLDRSGMLRLAMATAAANVMCDGTQAADMEQIQTLLPQARIERYV